MKGILATWGMLALIAAPSVSAAGTLYKCVGADGVPSYVSKRVSGAQCEVFSRYVPDRRPAARAPAVPPSQAPSSAPALAVPVAAGTSPATTTTTSPVPSGTAPKRVVSGQVYSYIKDGVRHYSSARPKGGANVAAVRTIQYSYIETCYACAARPGVDFNRLRLNTTAYSSEIAAAAREFGVEEAVVRAVIHAESAYNPTAVSHAGAQGLMQLMPATARRFGVTDSYDAGQNIRGGVQYLAWLLKRYNNDLTLAAAGYNAGEGAVDRHGGVPPYRETRYYVQRVGILADRYRQATSLN